MTMSNGTVSMRCFVTKFGKATKKQIKETRRYENQSSPIWGKLICKQKGILLGLNTLKVPRKMFPLISACSGTINCLGF